MIRQSGGVSSGSQILGASGAPATVNTGTAETQLASVAVPAGAMGLNGSLRITTFWTYTNSANNKTMRVRLGGAGGTVYGNVVQTTSTNVQLTTTISNKGAANSQKAFSPSTATATTVPITGTAITSAIDTSAATTVYISGQTATGGETITLESYIVELIPGA